MAAPTWSQSEDEGVSSQDEQETNSREDSEDSESSLHDALYLKMTELVEFLLPKYCAKQSTTKAEMLSKVIKEYEDQFPEILSLASDFMQVLFGIDVEEVDPSTHTYVLVTTLGLTYDGMVSSGQSMPNTGLLVMLLRLILAEGDCASEEEVWEALNVMGVHDGKEHWIYGEPRELLTKVWVQEGYLEYQQVPNSDPARYQFLWGPRAHAETTKLKVRETFLRDYRKDPSYVPYLSEEDISDEEEGA
ncbi:melanoma-associated antigen 10-like [Myotis myotis]|uniref:MAGE family member A11 n=1 Tax=Myotis myotis TaxID=51298 RepID=A0A7J7YFH8_MYOMY|nr:melanoma-associated antigen 10-like [Myotis myotis]KAF6360260.1 MAGE family member A11 [Myotis myotis]